MDGAIEDYLIAFRENNPAFRYGIPEILRAMRVLRDLRSQGRLPSDAGLLSAYIAPAICSSDEEQTAFRTAFNARFSTTTGGSWFSSKAVTGQFSRDKAESNGLRSSATNNIENPPKPPLKWKSILTFLACAGVVLTLLYAALGKADPRFLSWLRLLSASPPGQPASTYMQQRLPNLATVARPAFHFKVVNGDDLLALILTPLVILVTGEIMAALLNKIGFNRYRFRPMAGDRINFGPGHNTHLNPVVVAQAVQTLGAPIAIGRRIFDLPGTIRGLCRSGITELSFRDIPRARHYLILCKKNAFADHSYRIAVDLINSMNKGGIAAGVYTYSVDIRNLSPEHDQSPRSDLAKSDKHGLVDLDFVLEWHRGAVLLILDDGQKFAAGKLAAKFLSSCPDSAVITPVPVSEWGNTEAALQDKGLLVFSADTVGVRWLGSWVQHRDNPDMARPTVDLVRRDHRWAGSLGPSRLYPRLLRGDESRYVTSLEPDQPSTTKLLQQLKEFLGESGLLWLCALAVYPYIRADLTRELGRRLEFSSKMVFQEQDYLALSQLPWVSSGEMPDWLRLTLVKNMTRKTARLIVKELRQLMDLADAPLSGDILLKRDGWFLTGRLTNSSTRMAEVETVEDEILIAFMAGRLGGPSSTWQIWKRLGWRKWVYGPIGLTAIAIAILQFSGLESAVEDAKSVFPAIASTTLLILFALLLLLTIRRKLLLRLNSYVLFGIVLLATIYAVSLSESSWFQGYQMWVTFACALEVLLLPVIFTTFVWVKLKLYLGD